MQIIDTPSNLPRRKRTIQIGGQTFRYRLTWLERRRSWYFDLMQLDETPIMVGRRISANAATIPFNVPGFDPGGITVIGLDQYEQSDLGDSVTVFFVSQAELSAASAELTSDYAIELP